MFSWLLKFICECATLPPPPFPPLLHWFLLMFLLVIILFCKFLSCDSFLDNRDSIIDLYWVQQNQMTSCKSFGTAFILKCSHSQLNKSFYHINSKKRNMNMWNFFPTTALWCIYVSAAIQLIVFIATMQLSLGLKKSIGHFLLVSKSWGRETGGV